jgi:hypothetical protein
VVLKSHMPPDSITPKLLELALDAMEVVPGTCRQALLFAEPCAKKQ